MFNACLSILRASASSSSLGFLESFSGLSVHSVSLRSISILVVIVLCMRGMNVFSLSSDFIPVVRLETFL